MPAISSPGVIPDLQPRIVALAEPVLNPLASAPEALAHVRVKPPVSSVKRADTEAKPSRTPARLNRRPSFRQKKAFPQDQPLRHDEPAASAPAPAPAATANAIAAAPEPPPLVMAPVDGDVEIAVEAEPAYVSEALAPPPEGEGVIAAAPDAAAPTAEECVTYTDFIAETAREEASADDLNAGALAELIADQTACK